MSFMENTKVQNLALLVADHIRTLTLPSKRFSQPVAIILVGGPFSGKTTLVEHLAKKFPLAVLSDSNIGSFLAPRTTFFKRGSEEIFVLASRTIEEIIKQKVSVIYDASVKRRTDREALRKLVTNQGGKLLLVHVVMPEKEAYARLKKLNTQIVQGDRKGFILNKDLFDYELNTTDFPGLDEQPIEYHPLIGDTSREKIEDNIRANLRE